MTGEADGEDVRRMSVEEFGEYLERVGAERRAAARDLLESLGGES